VPRLSVLFALPASLWLWNGLPAYAHGCGHHGGYAYHGNCRSGDCGGSHDCPGCGNGYSTTRTTARTIEGKIAETIYLPGATADSAMVELRVVSGDTTVLVRLAPAGVLKQHQLSLKEGDAISVTGYTAGTMDGDLFIATGVNKQGRTIRLRDRTGRPIW